jgi:hypothetical protein
VSLCSNGITRNLQKLQLNKKKNKALPQLSVEAPYGMKLFETKQQVLKNWLLGYSKACILEEVW